MGFDYNFVEAFNRLQPAAVDKVLLKMNEIDDSIQSGKISSDEGSKLKFDLRIKEVGFLTIMVLEEYHQKLMEHLSKNS